MARASSKGRTTVGLVEGATVLVSNDRCLRTPQLSLSLFLSFSLSFSLSSLTLTLLSYLSCFPLIQSLVRPSLLEPDPVGSGCPFGNAPASPPPPTVPLALLRPLYQIYHPQDRSRIDLPLKASPHYYISLRVINFVLFFALLLLSPVAPSHDLCSVSLAP